MYVHNETHALSMFSLVSQATHTFPRMAGLQDWFLPARFFVAVIDVPLVV